MPTVQRYLGDAYWELGRLEDAAGMYRSSLKIKPDQAETRFRLGVIYLKQGAREAALEQHRELSKLDPDLAQKLADRFR